MATCKDAVSVRTIDDVENDDDVDVGRVNMSSKCSILKKSGLVMYIYYM